MWIPIYGKRGSNQKPLEHKPTKSDDMWNESKVKHTNKQTQINFHLYSWTVKYRCQWTWYLQDF